MINLTRSKKELVLICECGLEHHITKENNKIYLETVYKKMNVLSDEEELPIEENEIEVKQSEQEKKETKKTNNENLFDW